MEEQESVGLERIWAVPLLALAVLLVASCSLGHPVANSPEFNVYLSEPPEEIASSLPPTTREFLATLRVTKATTR